MEGWRENGVHAQRARDFLIEPQKAIALAISKATCSGHFFCM